MFNLKFGTRDKCSINRKLAEMTEPTLKPAEIRLALKSLKKRGMNYKLEHHSVEDGKKECLLLTCVHGGTEVCGKIVRSFNEGEHNYWCSLNHENIAPFIDVMYIRVDLSIFLTTYQQITLKEIVHDENFVYDSRCFDRKLSYARGIFSGLSYLHEKSLCLMNLTDDNIAICKIYDKAVITDLSCLACLKNTTGFKMEVPEMYKAPESGEREFDAMAAEIWASGALMLDMFLSHSVPWSIIDYNPKNVVKMIDMLWLEVLQAANVSSDVNLVDLTKFKLFLKPFFKQNPKTRISAKSAAIESFLCPRSRGRSHRANLSGSTLCRDTVLTTPQVEKECITPNGRSNNNDTNLSRFRKSNKQFQSIDKTSYENIIPINYSNSKNISRDIATCSKQSPTVSEPRLDTSTISTPVSSEEEGRQIPIALTEYGIAPATDSKHFTRDETFEESIDAIGVSLATTSQYTSNRGKGRQLIQDPLPFLYESDDLSTVSETIAGFEKTSKSCQIVTNAPTFNASDCPCYQSKSLSFMRSKLHDIENAVTQFCTERILSYSSSESVSMEQCSASDFQRSDQSLKWDKIAEELEEKKRQKADQDAFEVMRTGDGGKAIKPGDNIPDKQACHPAGSYKTHVAKSKQDIKISKLFNEPGFRNIKHKISFIRKCQVSLQSHSKSFVSKEFAYKQRKLLQEYQILLHQEKLRLHEILKTKYRPKLDNRDKFSRPLNTEVRKSVNQYETLLQNRIKTLSHNSGQNKFWKAEKTKENVEEDAINVNSYTDRFKDSNATQNLRPNRNYSYKRAIEAFERHACIIARLNQNDKEEQRESAFATGYRNSEEKLIESGNERTKENVEEDAINVNSYTDRFKDSNATQNVCPNRNYSYERIIEASENGIVRLNQNEKEEERESAFATGYCNSEEKLIASDVSMKGNFQMELKNNKKNNNMLKKVKKVKNNKEGLKKVKKEKKSSEKKEAKRSNFFSLCPGGHVEETERDLDNLCEACKLNFN